MSHKEKRVDSTRKIRICNVLIHSALQNGPFRTVKWAVLRGEMGRIALRNGPFRKTIRHAPSARRADGACGNGHDGRFMHAFRLRQMPTVWPRVGVKTVIFEHMIMRYSIILPKFA